MGWESLEWFCWHWLRLIGTFVMGGGELNEIGVSIRNHTSSTKHSLFTRVLSVVFFLSLLLNILGGGGGGILNWEWTGVKKSHIKSKRWVQWLANARIANNGIENWARTDITKPKPNKRDEEAPEGGKRELAPKSRKKQSKTGQKILYIGLPIIPNMSICLFSSENINHDPTGNYDSTQ